MIACDEVRAAVLARLDGVEAIWRGPRVADHLDSCEACRAWEAGVIAEYQRQRARRRRQSDAPVQLPSTAVQEGRSKDELLRYILGVVAATEVLLGIGAIAFQRNLHPFRELAAADLAFAIGCLAAALQPKRALGVVPVAVALAVLILGTAAFDLANGSAGPLGESHHLLELTGAVALIVLARRGRPLAGMR